MAGAQALVTRFSADTLPAQKAIGQMVSTAVTQLASLSSMAIKASQNMQAISGAAQGAQKALSLLSPQNLKIAAGAIAGLFAIKFALDSIDQASQAAREQLQKLVDIGAKAQSAGVGSNFLQGWLGQAKELNLEAGKLEAMLTKARAATEIKIGEGGEAANSDIGRRLGEHVAAGNISKEQASSITGAATQEEAIRATLNLLQQLQAEGKNLAALDIGRHMLGADFEQKLRQGVDIIGQMRLALDGMKVSGGERVFTEEEIRRAQYIQGLIDDTQNKLANGLRPIQEDIAIWSQKELQNWEEMKNTLAGWVEAAGQFYEVLRKIPGVMADIGNAAPFAALVKGMRSAGLISSDIVFPDQEYGPTGRDLPEGWKPEQARELTIHGDKSKSLKGRAKSGGGSQTDEVKTYIDQLSKQVDVLKAEAEAYGKSNIEKAKAVDLARAEAAARVRGTPLTEKERDAVLSLAEAEGKQKDSLAKLQQQASQSRDQLQFAGNTLLEALDAATQKGATFQSVMQGVVRSLEQAALKAVVLGEGPLAGLFGTAAAPGATGSASVGGLFGLLGGGLGSLFKGGATGNFAGHAAGEFGPFLPAGIPGFADGGIVPGSPGDPVLALVHGGEKISNIAQQRAEASRGGRVSVTHAPTYNIKPAEGVTPAQLQVVIDRNNRAFAQRLPAILADRDARRI